MKLKNLFYAIIMLLATASCSKVDDFEDLTGSIYGKITDAMTGEVIDSATVSISPTGASTTTGSDGAFQFTGLSADQYTIQVQKNNYTSNYNVITNTAGQTASCDITMAPISSTSKIELSTSVVTLTEDYSSQTITINNIGSSGTASWSITEISADWLTISPSSGDTAEGKSSTVIVTADFDKISTTTFTNVIVNADGESVPLMIKVSIDSDSSSSTTDSDQTTTDDSDTATDDSDTATDDSDTATDDSDTATDDSDTATDDSDTATDDSDTATDDSDTATDDSDTTTDGGDSAMSGGGTTTTTSTLADGLFVYYTFEENTTDQTDTGLNGRIMGTASYVDNPIDGTKAIKFSEIEESSLYIANPLINNEKSTISFWVNGLADGVIFHVKTTSGTIGQNLILKNSKLGFYDYTYMTWNYYDTFFAHGTITDYWHMITVTRNSDDNQAQLYIDGEWWDTIDTKCWMFGTESIFYLGGDPNYNTELANSWCFSDVSAIAMSVDNLRVYDTRVLSASEIKELYELESK